MLKQLILFVYLRRETKDREGFALERETDRQTDRERGREAERERGREADRETETET